MKRTNCLAGWHDAAEERLGRPTVVIADTREFRILVVRFVRPIMELKPMIKICQSESELVHTFQWFSLSSGQRNMMLRKQIST